jgi:hypothetical protein
MFTADDAAIKPTRGKEVDASTHRRLDGAVVSIGTIIDQPATGCAERQLVIAGRGRFAR